MNRLATLGNDLYSGARSVDIVGNARRWYALSAVLIAIALTGLGVRGLNMSLEFTGGSEFRVATSSVPAGFEGIATGAVRTVAGRESQVRVTQVGSNTIRVQTSSLTNAETSTVQQMLSKVFGLPSANVSSSFIGPSWGSQVSAQALRALVVFLIAVASLMAVYFRTWKMAAAALVALVHDMIITVGIYALVGLEVSPATIIGFLTVLGYSLYDTVVVFDKVRENTTEAFVSQRFSFDAAANQAVNQTLVRSINTTVVALLPILAVLILGFTVLGPGTLLDLTLALFIGMAVGAFSSIFIATPIYVWLRRTEPAVQALRVATAKALVGPVALEGLGANYVGETDQPAAKREPASGTIDPAFAMPSESAVKPTGVSAPTAGADTTVTGRAVHRYASSSQPRPERKQK